MQQLEKDFCELEGSVPVLLPFLLCSRRAGIRNQIYNTARFVETRHTFRFTDAQQLGAGGTR